MGHIEGFSGTTVNANTLRTSVPDAILTDMDIATANKLSQLTTTFYKEVAASFSATRQDPWQGWQRVLEETDLAERESLRLLDLACGNLRFERFLAAKRTTPMCVHAVDTCDELVLTSPIENSEITYTHLDLTDTERLADALGRSAYNAAVCFGFMHHLPLSEQRETLLRALVKSVRPQGFVVLTFWQLSKSERLLAKARESTERAATELKLEGLGPHDYLLGWQDRSDVFRFCHDFTDAEIDALVSTVAPNTIEVARFSADGATGDLNRYLILRIV